MATDAEIDEIAKACRDRVWQLGWGSVSIAEMIRQIYLGRVDKDALHDELAAILAAASDDPAVPVEFTPEQVAVVAGLIRDGLLIPTAPEIASAVNDEAAARLTA